MRGALALVLLVLGGLGCSSGQDGPRGAGGGQSTGGSASMGGAPAAGGAAPVAGTTAAAGMPVNSAGTGSGGAPVVGTETGAQVMTWVPTYRIAESKQQLAASFDGVAVAAGLSYVGLQFWLTAGPATQLKDASEADVTWFQDWGRQHGVKVLMCVHNHDGDWNWPEAVRSFRDNRAAFAAHLLSEVARRNLDGVDLDLEGIVDATAEEADAYRQLVQLLSDGLHPLGKVLTVDSFHGQWNAPNWNWWPDLLPLVDGITSMGYEQSGMDVDYATLVEHAAVAPHKLMIGVPSYQGVWQGRSVTEQLGWLVQQGQVGTSIWDASLMAVEWRQRGVWEQLRTIETR
jgi:hypothetical protein